MDFSLNEEQTLLKESVAKYVGNDYDINERRTASGAELGFNQQHWANFAELGWLTVPIPEAAGGFGGNVEDTAVLMEEFGRGLVLEPFLANIVLVGQIIARSNNAGAINDVLSAIMAGTQQSALAAQERQSRQNFFDVATSATAVDEGYVINGTKVLVDNGAAADTLVVTTRTSGAQRDTQGITLLLVDANATGIERHRVAMMDGTTSAIVQFDNVTVSRSSILGSEGAGWLILEPVLREARIAACAEALGIMCALHEKTVEYTKTRTQFDVPIGSFQALQHRMVDMFMTTVQARSILFRAICEYQQNNDTLTATIAAMKSMIGKYGRHIGSEAIQMHGGMGMTDELDIGHYVKRGMVLNQMFGDLDDCQREFCDLRYAS